MLRDLVYCAGCLNVFYAVGGFFAHHAERRVDRLQIVLNRPLNNKVGNSHRARIPLINRLQIM